MKPDALRLMSWNLAGRVKTNPDQVDALANKQLDIIALQEIRLKALRNLKNLLPRMNLPQVVQSVYRLHRKNSILPSGQEAQSKPWSALLGALKALFTQREAETCHLQT